MLKRPLSIQYHDFAGFMLMECLFVMTISSILLVCIGRAYPYIINELTSSYQQYRLEIYLKQRLQLLEMQLRRAGYCNGDCTVKKASLPAPLKIGHYPYHPHGSCVLFVYDMNNNGRWESPEEQESDYFGFRLKNGQLEQRRGVQNCDSTGWQQIFEKEEIEVTEFILTPYTHYSPTKKRAFNYLSLSLKFQAKQNINLKVHYQTSILLRNIS
ncbi:TPA: prepilin peptidase-dependent protein [Proteus mirabilis]|uniref:prepilin peptidase-dependent protein n=1 Tax=Proteus mirabilis TaxID=584 RepID=UPI0013D03AA2|nr:prepilin peptidase-dependent protein [Proteus mirabilis]MBG2846811.1 prepilin peptidase-dependent protein [Proteus mirabilis]MBG3121675.1 prepilin peptidase-dependent protein [Proteus mirabilis]MBI6292630.1 prepilin peptidase-dependent protein [Proteus mirabilis]MBI6323575.1 prepilin peptidase-dependent protein [Proteus mirabilis]MBI6399106.1 prepilin peptidase-dependent protein [Proteus mirabilis]